MNRQAVILAGGFGTRLRAVFGDIPKPMVPLMGKPVLEHLVERCEEHGFNDILVLAHHKHDVISSHFGDRVRMHVESEPKGTAGALIDALPLLHPQFLVLYGDTYADVDLNALWSFHHQHRADATLFIHPNSHPHDSDLIELDDVGRVTRIHPYPHPEGQRYRNKVNAAMYVMNRDILDGFESSFEKPDIAKHLFPQALTKGKTLMGYESVEYVKDMGTPERLVKVEADILRGVPERLSSRSPRRAIFLDRDGTLNVEKGLIREPEGLTLIEGVPEAVKKINQSGYVSVVVTNQPVIARGEVTPQGLDQIHATLDTLLGVQGAYLDRILYCPHHPDSGYPGEVVDLKIQCDCRKPGTGMIDQATSMLTIDRAASWMIGDTTTDMEAARNAGVRSILVRTGHAGTDGKYPAEPDYVMPDLGAAVDWILEGHDRLSRKISPIVEAIGQNRLLLIGGLSRSGKSSLAQILKEQLAMTGRTAHILSLDGWLKPTDERAEGQGVGTRFDLATATRFVMDLLGQAESASVRVPIYERITRILRKEPRILDIQPSDLLIVEGVPALMCSELVSLSSIRVYTDVDRDERIDRLHKDYAWRGMDTQEIDRLIASRDSDETEEVRRSCVHARFIIQTGTGS
jgi:D,D-heptose 1,7-bisphosphate phosphatase